ncbi:sporulation protein YqfD [Gorillibacterium timonense]|uniref:sporulation protein YqfD n=1 Tax=Gorillibacterium timonense TaxID=1689269 RepID=UPI00071CDEC4|nr:sporulation protein YqfD [Gorillibacterium timonense]
MRAPSIAFIRGYLTLSLKGGKVEAFLNEAAREGLRLWDVQLVEPGIGRLKLDLSDFFRLRPILKRTGCRIHVEGRHGFPFWVKRVAKRKLFLAGALGFLVGLFLLTSLVWRVDVMGNEKLSKQTVLSAARQEGIYRHQWIFRLKGVDELARGLMTRLPDATWIGVERNGTSIRIRIVETTKPEDKPLASPRHLIAKKDALVTKIFAEKGKPVVAPNTYVRKGQLLISGQLGDGEHRKWVPATGKVFGLVWYVSTIEVPMEQVHRTYTGESAEKSYLIIGKRALQITGYGKGNYEHSVTIGTPKMLSFRQFTLPIGWLKDTVRESEEIVYKLSAADAEAKGLKRARDDLLLQAGEGSRIAGEKVLSRKEENGKLILKVHYEVEEEITSQLALVEAP